MNESNASQDGRLQSMEERITFQQRQLDDLHQVVLGHEQQVVALGREVARLTAALKQLSELALGGDLPHEKPPHY
jgi:uncharacterized coiled-coil protein SlyX